ncbi:MAG: hypothetical protein Q9167_003366 [Letrouitia subvulpina]
MAAALFGSAVYLSPCCATPFPQSSDEVFNTSTTGLTGGLGNRPVAPIDFNLPQGMLHVVVTFPNGDDDPLDPRQIDRIIENLEDFASFQGRPQAIVTHPIRTQTGLLKGELTPVNHEPFLTVGETEAFLGEMRNLIHSRRAFYDMHIVVRKRGVIAMSGGINNIRAGEVLPSYLSLAPSATSPAAVLAGVAAPITTSTSVPAAAAAFGPGPSNIQIL